MMKTSPGLIVVMVLLASLALGLGAGASYAGPFADGLAAYDAGDYQTSIEAWRPLAEAGDAEAQVALAGLYSGGFGVRVDAAIAADWYRRAAEQGDAVAQLNLGDLYGRGLGVGKDPVQAYLWLSLSAQQGRIWPEERRQQIAATMTDAQLAEARDLLSLKGR